MDTKSVVAGVVIGVGFALFVVILSIDKKPPSDDPTTYKYRDWHHMWSDIGGVTSQVPNTELTRIRFENEKLTCYILQNTSGSMSCIRE